MSFAAFMPGEANPLIGVAQMIDVTAANVTNDGTKWVGVGQPQYGETVAYGKGLFVSVGPTNNAMHSGDGVNWLSATSFTGSGYDWSVAYNATAGVFSAVTNTDSAGSGCYTSTDGINWTSRAAPPYLFTLRACGGLFFGFYLGGDAVYTSPDGYTWTAQTMPVIKSWYDVAYTGSQFVVVALTGNVATSTNGSSWSAGTSLPAAVNLGSYWAPGVAYGNGLLVVPDAGATTVYYSSNGGSTWSTSTAPVALGGVSFGAGLFMAPASAASNQMYTSPDAVTWTARTMSSTQTWGPPVFNQ